jgi:acetyl esterase/lipase
MLVIVCLAGAALLAREACAQNAYQPPRTVVYGRVMDGELSLNVLVPTGAPNGLGIIVVASGAGYSSGAKYNEQEHIRIANTFCGRGYTLFVVKPGPPTKYSVINMTDHLQKGIVFVKEHANDYNVDAGRLGLMSTRGGIHLVCLVAITADDKTAVKGAGVYIPPTDTDDPTAQNLYIQADTAAWEQVRQQAFQGAGADVSPASAAPFAAGARNPAIKLPKVSPKAPPFLIIHGDADPTAPRLDSNAFFAAMRDVDVAHDMIVKRPGPDVSATIQAELTTLADWFDKQLRVD